MNNSLKLLVATLINLLFLINVKAQYAPPYPILGRPMPELILQNIKHYPKTKVNVKEFRGKWLMLDVWERFCGGCINSFPSINHKRKRFANRMEIILVAFPNAFDPSQQEGEQKLTEELFAKHVVSDSLDLPCAFNNDIAVQWDIAAVPYVVIIDPKGIVRAITSSISEDKLDSLLNGFNPILKYAMRSHEDKGSEARPSIGATIFTAIEEPNSYQGPRFAFANDNDFPVMINTNNLNGTWDTISARKVGKFHEGDYRTCLQVYNVTYEMTYEKFRGKANALHYQPEQLKGPMPSGDWIIHFKWDKNWKTNAVKLNY